MLMKCNDDERHDVRLHGYLYPIDRGATVISFSSTGCAFRTTAHLQKGEKIALTLSLHPEPIRLVGEIVWTAEDYRIDTFYAYGMKFLEPVHYDQISQILATEAKLSIQDGPLYPV